MAKSIVQKKDEFGDEIRACYLTGRTGELDKHHIFNGAFRDKSEEYGLWVYLDHDVHMQLHHTPKGQKYARRLKEIAQEQFERNYGHEKFIEIFRRNYL